MLYAFIPACCTGELQPLDLTVNSVFKKKQRELFAEWYANEMKKQFEKGDDIASVDLRLSFVKPQHAKWLIENLKFLEEKRDVLVKGFELAGILDCFDGAAVEANFEQEGAIATQEEVNEDPQYEDDSSDDEELTAVIARLRAAKNK